MVSRTRSRSPQLSSKSFLQRGCPTTSRWYSSGEHWTFFPDISIRAVDRRIYARIFLRLKLSLLDSFTRGCLDSCIDGSPTMNDLIASLFALRPSLSSSGFRSRSYRLDPLENPNSDSPRLSSVAHIDSSNYLCQFHHGFVMHQDP